jgi:hypothetical protein
MLRFTFKLFQKEFVVIVTNGGTNDVNDRGRKEVREREKVSR